MKDPKMFARNPLADELKTNPMYAARAQRTRPPTLFLSGDLPLTTASGNSPSDLLRLPWQMRHAAAKADQGEWARLMNQFGSGDDESVQYGLMFDAAVRDPGNDDYASRIQDWVYSRSGR
jgi:hypothetical protein